MPYKVADPVARFWAKVDKSGECWIWTGARQTFGYGLFSIRHKLHYAHRFAWFLFNGPIPVDMGVLHRCDNPPCCNPAHLFLGTKVENNADRHNKGRDAKGNQHPNAKLTPEIVRELRRQRAAGVTYSALAAEHGVAESAVHNAVNGKTWAHI